MLRGILTYQFHTLVTRRTHFCMLPSFRITLGVVCIPTSTTYWYVAALLLYLFLPFFINLPIAVVPRMQLGTHSIPCMHAHFYLFCFASIKTGSPRRACDAGTEAGMIEAGFHTHVGWFEFLFAGFCDALVGRWNDWRAEGGWKRKNGTK